MVASWAPDTAETAGREELARRAGRSLSDADVERLAAMNVVRADGDGYHFDAGLLRLAVQLLDVPLSQEAILAAREVMIEHSRAAARELSRLFRSEVSERAEEDVKSLSAHMQPIVVQALLTTFQRSLKEEVHQWLTVSEDGRPA